MRCIKGDIANKFVYCVMLLPKNSRFRKSQTRFLTLPPTIRLYGRGFFNLPPCQPLPSLPPFGRNGRTIALSIAQDLSAFGATNRSTWEHVGVWSAVSVRSGDTWIGWGVALSVFGQGRFITCFVCRFLCTNCNFETALNDWYVVFYASFRLQVRLQEPQL